MKAKGTNLIFSAMLSASMVLCIAGEGFCQEAIRMLKDLNNAGKTLIEADEFSKTYKSIRTRFSADKTIYFEISKTPLEDVEATVKAFQDHPNISGLTVDEAATNLLLLFVDSKSTLMFLWKEMPAEISARFRLEMDSETSFHFIVDNEGIQYRSLKEILDDPNSDPLDKLWVEASGGEPPKKNGVREYLPWMTLSDSLTKACERSKASEKIKVAVAPFLVSAYINETNPQPAGRVIAYLETMSCFRVVPDAVESVPKGTQVLIGGELKEYHTSSGEFGRPSMLLEIEIRNANSMELIAKKEIEIEGKIYGGKGYNKALDELWHEVMSEAMLLVFSHRAALQKLEPTREEKPATLRAGAIATKE